MRDGFIFYRSFFSALDVLSDKDLAEAFRLICAYGLDETEIPTENPTANAIFIMAKPQIDANQKRYENGKMGGRPKTKPEPNETKPEPKEKEKVKVKEKEKAVLPDRKEKDLPEVGRKRKQAFFTPPTVAEVRSYCAERANNVDAERFVDFYAAKGWMVGKNKMKDWKAAVRTWEKQDAEREAKSGSPQGASARQGTVPRGNPFLAMLREEESRGY